MSIILFVLAIIGVLAPPAGAAEETSAAALKVEGTSFLVAMPDGHNLTSSDLVGAKLKVADEAGRFLTLRIDNVRRDASDPNGDIWLHELSLYDTGSGTWRGLCSAAPDGTSAGFPLAGQWTPDGRHLRELSAFTITCASGAIGKCVRLGYRPWAERAGQSLRDHHQACVRMMRADYNGDGIPHTRDGTLVEVFDRLGIQQPDVDPIGLRFEAAWGPDGAICVRRTRIPEILLIETLAERHGRLGRSPNSSECSEATPAIIWNRS